MKRRATTFLDVLISVTVVLLVLVLLLPLFDQSRYRNRQATDLDNIKQLSLAHAMYWSDNDERMVSSRFQGAFGDYNFLVQPFIKNESVMISPFRTVTNSELAGVCRTRSLYPGEFSNPLGDGVAWGYGYNTGFDIDDGNGLVSPAPQVPPGMGVVKVVGKVRLWVPERQNPMIGKPLAEVQNKARVLLLGNSGSLPPMSFSRWWVTPYSEWSRFSGTDSSPGCESTLMDWRLSMPLGVDAAYVDGHVRFVPTDSSLTVWRTSDSKGQVRSGPKALENPCEFFSEFTGSNSPGQCATGDAVGVFAPSRPRL